MTATSIEKAEQSRRITAFSSVGAPGTAIYGGYIVENEKDPRVSGRQKFTTFSNMLANASIVAAGVRLFLNLVSKAAWNADPIDDSAEAVEVAEFVKSVMDDMTTPWHRVVRRAAMFRFYGFSIQEWTAKRRDDGKIGLLDIEARPQQTIERWDVDESGTLRGVFQENPTTSQEHYLPRGKTIYCVDDSLNDSPAGLGLFRHLVSRYHALQRYELLEAWGFERDLRGTPIGRGPLAEMAKLVTTGTLTAEQVAELRAPIEAFVSNALKGKDTGLILDSAVYRTTDEHGSPSSTPQWTVELLSGQTTSQPEMAKAIERLNREMARVMGVEHLLLGADSKGSHALSADKSLTFGLLVASTLQELVGVFQADFLDPLFQLNGWDPKLKPKLTVEAVQYRDIVEVTTALRDMATAGVPIMPDDPVVNVIRKLLGLPNQPESSIDLALELKTQPIAVMEQEAAMAAEAKGESVPPKEPPVQKHHPKGGKKAKKPPTQLQQALRVVAASLREPDPDMSEKDRQGIRSFLRLASRMKKGDD